jgi:hypothetical protein
MFSYPPQLHHNQRAFHQLCLKSVHYWLQAPISIGKIRILEHKSLVAPPISLRLLVGISHLGLSSVYRYNSKEVQAVFSLPMEVSSKGIISPFRNPCNTNRAEPKPHYQRVIQRDSKHFPNHNKLGRLV